MQLRGTVTDVGEPRTVDTQYGEREVVDVGVRLDGGCTTVSLWGKWTETADYLEPGMALSVTGVEEREYDGATRYTTTGESFVVVEPEFLVDVTAVRSFVQCPRLYYLNKLSGVPLAEPVTKGTVVHEVFGDLLRGRDLEEAVEERVEEASLELGLLGEDPGSMRETVRQHAGAIEGWLAQGTLTDEDAWRSEMTLVSPTFGIKGRADAVRRGMPVELKTGKNTNRDPRFHDKVQAACYALAIADRSSRREGTAAAADGGEAAGVDERAGSADAGVSPGAFDPGLAPDTATLLYTKNAAVDRAEASGDLSPAKEFSVGAGLLKFVVRARNHLAALEVSDTTPTGYEGDAKCEYCFEVDTCRVVSGRLGQESKAGQIGEQLPAAEREYFEEWYDRVESERRHVHREYAKLWTQSPGERAGADRALVDLAPAGRERTGDGRWRLAAERPGPATSKFREGDTVLASDGDPVAGDAELATVETLAPERVVVTTDEPLELRRLDVYPSELSVDRMLTSLHDAVLKSGERRRDVLFGRADPAFRDASGTYVENNAAQNEAVNLAVNAEDFALVHGPPGTGKTYTVATILRELVDRGERVLLSGFTNRAVDNLLEAVRDRGFENVVRVGTETGVRADMRDLLLDNVPPGDQERRLREAPVVAATTASCGSRAMREQSFDVALIDEASQLTEPDTLSAVNRADRFVLVGDHRQLPPVVKEPAMDASLFERLMDAHPEASVLLDRQYRMNQRVQAFASREFYDGALRPATGEVAGRSLADLGVDAGDLPPGLRGKVTFHDVPGDDRDHVDENEAARVADLVDAYRAAGVPLADVAVIAPYRAQVGEIERRVPDGVTVDTVDRFQGSATEVVLVSFVASTTPEGPIFEDTRRLNVALTRAKRAMALVGTASALRGHETYARMVDWAARGD